MVATKSEGFCPKGERMDARIASMQRQGRQESRMINKSHTFAKHPQAILETKNPLF
jgi:hypothetical protein